MDKRTPESNVGHFVALFYKGGNPNSDVVFFDPYGNKIDKLLKLTRNRNNLMRLIRESGKKLDMNKWSLQEMSDKVSTCGR